MGALTLPVLKARQVLAQRDVSLVESFLDTGLPGHLLLVLVAELISS